MASLKALFWDVDGTLADTEMDGHRPAFNAAFHDLELPFIWDEELYAELLVIPGGQRRVQHYAREQGRELTAGQLDQIRDRKRVHYRQRALDGAIRIRPGVRRLLVELGQQGIDQWIVTSSGRASVEALFSGQPDLKPMFQGVVTADDVSQGKPAPDLYREAQRRSGHRADSILAIEDSEAGFLSAQAAGLRCVLTPSPWESSLAPMFDQAAAVFDHLGDVDQPMHQCAGPSCAGSQVTVEYLSSLFDGRE